MVTQRQHAVCRGSNTTLDPAIGRFVETFDSSFESLDTSLDALNQTIDPAVDRIVETFNSTLLIITQS